MSSPFCGSGRVQDIAQRHPAPARRAGGRRAPRLLSRDVANGEQPRSAVARALQRRDELAVLEAVAQVVEPERHLTVDESLHS